MKMAILATVLVCCAIIFVWAYRSEQKIERGRQAFAKYQCASCHFAGSAPNLQNVGMKYSEDAITQFLQDPDQVYRARGNRPLNEKYQRMPKLKLDPQDVPALVAYLAELSDQ